MTVEGPFADSLGAPEDNLVMRAALALAGHCGIERPGAAIRLEKNLPVASGIGGGSADAAAALKALRDLWVPETDDDELARIGLSLGADIPVCLFSRTARFSGVGETVQSGKTLPSAGVLLANPGVALSTAAVFGRRSGEFSDEADDCGPWADAAAMAAGLMRSRNDLTDAATELAPEIGETLEAVSDQPGCLLARLSGSGATCFGLFPDDETARAAEQSIAALYPSWWVCATRFREEGDDTA